MGKRQDTGCGLRVILLTYQCERAGRIAEDLVSRGVRIDTVVLATPSMLDNARRLMRILPVRRVVLLGLQRLRASLQPAGRNWRRPEFYRPLAKRVVVVPDLNSEECMRRLDETNADIGVAGCAPILRPGVFNSFRLGVLNMHPGFLPEYRGRSPIEWTLVEGGEPGVTLHFIDSGVDTGPVISKATVRIERGDTIRALYRKADHIGVSLLVSALKEMEDGQLIATTPQPPVKKTAYRSVTRDGAKVACRRLAERVAREPGRAD